MPRVETHIAVVTTGYRASVRIHGVLYQKRFPADTPIQEIRTWLLRHRLKHGRPTVRRTGRFVDDARVYLQTVTAMPTYAQRAQHIEEWIAAFGPLRRAAITSDMITAQLHAWRTTPRTVARGHTPDAITVTLSPAAVNKRRSALMHMYTTLDGKSEPNPVKDTPKFAEPAPAPRALPYQALRAIFAAMPDSATKARLMLLAYTGIPPAEIAQLTAADVDLAGARLAVPGRKKGRGTDGRVVPLTPDGVRAVKAMMRHQAWGTFSRTVLRRVFLRALKAANVPGHWRPYDLRHTFGTEVYRRSGDIRATQLLLGQSTPQLTHRYTVAAEDPRVAAAVQSFKAKGGR